MQLLYAIFDDIVPNYIQLIYIFPIHEWCNIHVRE